jgi:hypothetical protein
VTALAVIRSSDVELPLFLHVLGAMLTVGTLFATAAALLLAWRRADVEESTALTRFGLRWLLLGVVPSFVLMRVAAQWTYSEENLDALAEEPAWVGVGFVTSDLGGVLLLVSIVLAIVGLLRLRTPGRGAVFGRIVGIVSVLILVAYLIAVWAMTAKPD